VAARAAPARALAPASKPNSDLRSMAFPDLVDSCLSDCKRLHEAVGLVQPRAFRTGAETGGRENASVDRKRSHGHMWALAAAGLLALAPLAAFAQSPGPTAMVDNPCSGVRNAGVPGDLIQPLLEPGARFAPSAPQDQAASAAAAAELRRRDWAELCRYRAANAALSGPPTAVFIGDSITDFWAVAQPDFFSGGIVDRGVSGQTTPQMLVRFRNDVIALRPKVVHIMAGTNDVAGNTGPTTEADFEGVIQSMVELAKAHQIEVVLASIPPTGGFGWRPEMKPAGEILRLNAWLKTYAAQQGLRYVDYHGALASADGAFRPDLSNDGVHPNMKGYAVMRRLAELALAAK
jgi:lysophospholipase L1-like esterase